MAEALVYVVTFACLCMSMSFFSSHYCECFTMKASLRNEEKETREGF